MRLHYFISVVFTGCLLCGKHFKSLTPPHPTQICMLVIPILQIRKLRLGEVEQFAYITPMWCHGSGLKLSSYLPASQNRTVVAIFSTLKTETHALTDMLLF